MTSTTTSSGIQQAGTVAAGNGVKWAAKGILVDSGQPWNYKDPTQYGQIYYDSTTTIQTLATLANTIYPIISQSTSAWIAGNTNGVSTNVATGYGQLTILTAGIYKINYNITVSSSAANQTWQTYILQNGTPMSSVTSATKIQATSAFLTSCANGLISLSANDIVSIGVECDGAGNTLTMRKGSITVIRVG